MNTQGVVINVLRKNHQKIEFLYLKRSGGNFKNQWWPVAGTCNPDETVIQTVLRELEEETGLSPIDVYELGMEIKHMDSTSKLEGFVAFVPLDNLVRLNYEHSEFKWLSLSEVLETQPKIVHPVIQHIDRAFVLSLPTVESKVWSSS